MAISRFFDLIHIALFMFMFVNYRNSTSLLSKQQYYAEDDNYYRHDDAYGTQPERATTG